MTRAKGAPRRAMGGRRHQENIRGSARGLRRLDGDGGAGSGARRWGSGMSTRCRGHLALVLRVDGLAASLFPFRSLATPAAREDQAPARGACRAGEKTPVVVAASKGDDGVWGKAGR